jgi:hypothetical protein
MKDPVNIYRIYNVWKFTIHGALTIYTMQDNMISFGGRTRYSDFPYIDVCLDFMVIHFWIRIAYNEE